ncbi:MAG: T9SS type A sorting domain-containing protein [Candidatus Hatepunaea meridiana]|nr:T9SS type A sorting domain-containing protein [Candidatus Hatepunaea meridiana]
MYCKIKSSPLIKWSFLALTAFFLLVTFLNTESVAYERKLLAEIFTNSYCPLCPRYIPNAQDALENDLDDEDFVIIQYHTWWPDNRDPWFWENYIRKLPGDDDCLARMSWLGYDQFIGVPSFFFNGYRIHYSANLGRDVSNYIDDRMDVESPLYIELEAFVHDDTLHTCATVTSNNRFLRLTLFVALCEHEVYYQAPSGQQRFTGNMIDMIPDGSGEEFNIMRNQPMPFEYESLFDIGWRDNEFYELFVLAWVQDEEHEVLQTQNVEITRLEADAPRPFDLLTPQDGFEVSRRNWEVTFEWEESVDINNEDVVYDLLFQTDTEGYRTASQEDIEETEFTLDMDSLLNDLDISIGVEEREIYLDWWVVARNENFSTRSDERREFSMPIPASAPSAEEIQLKDFQLFPAYPNPFNSHLIIPFQLNQSGKIIISVHNLSGREIGRLAEGNYNAGQHTALLDADKYGLVNGIYYLSLTVEDKVRYQKVVYIR